MESRIFRKRDSKSIDPRLTLGRLDKSILKNIESYLDRESKASFRQVMDPYTKENEMRNFLSLITQFNPNKKEEVEGEEDEEQEQEEQEEQDEEEQKKNMKAFLKMMRKIRFDDLLGSLSGIKTINEIQSHIRTLIEKTKDILIHNTKYLEIEPSSFPKSTQVHQILKYYEKQDKPRAIRFFKHQIKLAEFIELLKKYKNEDDAYPFLDRYRLLVEEHLLLMDDLIHSIRINNIFFHMMNATGDINVLSEDIADELSNISKKAQSFLYSKGIKKPIKISLSNPFSDEKFDDWMKKVNKVRKDDPRTRKEIINDLNKDNKLTKVILPSFIQSLEDWVKNYIYKVKFIFKDIIPYLKPSQLDILNLHLKSLELLQIKLIETINKSFKEEERINSDQVLKNLRLLLKFISNLNQDLPKILL
jgi:hypothetical protein